MTRSAQSRYPGYNVLDKQNTPSWDDATRQVIGERLATPNDPRFFNAVEWLAMTALCRCVITQGTTPGEVPLAALVDRKLEQNHGDGYRNHRLPPMRDAWRTGLAALDDESRQRFELPFASIEKTNQLALLKQMQRGELKGLAWNGTASDIFFAERVLHDICSAYYSHPASWNEIGFGGPANPRGYVRLYFDRRDPWEAAEATPGNETKALKENQHAR